MIMLQTNENALHFPDNLTMNKNLQKQRENLISHTCLPSFRRSRCGMWVRSCWAAIRSSISFNDMWDDEIGIPKFGLKHPCFLPRPQSSLRFGNSVHINKAITNRKAETGGGGGTGWERGGGGGPRNTRRPCDDSIMATIPRRKFSKRNKGRKRRNLKKSCASLQNATFLTTLSSHYYGIPSFLPQISSIIETSTKILTKMLYSLHGHNWSVDGIEDLVDGMHVPTTGRSIIAWFPTSRTFRDSLNQEISIFIGNCRGYPIPSFNSFSG